MTCYPNFEFLSILLSVMHAGMEPLLVFDFVVFNSYRSNEDPNTKAGFVFGRTGSLKLMVLLFFLSCRKTVRLYMPSF